MNDFRLMQANIIKYITLETLLAILLTTCWPYPGTADTVEPQRGAISTPQQSTWDRSYGGADKSYDTELLRLREEIAPRFQTLEFADKVTGRTMVYNLYVPKNYDVKTTYPLVLFMADGSTTGKGAQAPLKQGYGGIIWAKEESQAQHPCFVLVPAYQGPENTVNDQWQVSDEVDMTLRLLESVVASYNIDRNRLYTTGQSMGGMMSFYFNVTHPDLFAASIFVGSQWDIKVLAPLAQKKFFYIVSAGDPKASKGMEQLGAMLLDKGVSYGKTEFSAKLSLAQQNSMIQHLLREGRPINFVQFSQGTVLPTGPHDRGGEHLYSFDYAYKLDAVRNWLFQQSKDSKAQQLYQQGRIYRDEQQAFASFLQSAELGYGPAQAQVGEAYEKGRGIAKDLNMAISWYYKAIAQGVERSMLNLGILYLNGTGVARDYARAGELFRAAWRLGNMKAPRYLGIMQEEGMGGVVDYGAAFHFYQEAAQAGDITAKARIGWLFERGLGVEQSYPDALHWYLQAAPSVKEATKNVHPRVLALVRLGYLYEKGLGVKQDSALARSWYRVAAKDNSAEARSALHRLSLQAGK